MAACSFKARLAQANLITKTDFDAKLSSLNRKITQNKTKHLLVENELNKLKTFDSSYFIGKSHFEEDGTQNYLVFQPMYRFFKKLAIVALFHHGNLKDSLMKIFSPPTAPDISLTPALSFYGTKERVKFTESSLKQDNIAYTHEKRVIIFIVYAFMPN